MVWARCSASTMCSSERSRGLPGWVQGQRTSLATDAHSPPLSAYRAVTAGIALQHVPHTPVIPWLRHRHRRADHVAGSSCPTSQRSEAGTPQCKVQPVCQQGEGALHASTTSRHRQRMHLSPYHCLLPCCKLPHHVCCVVHRVMAVSSFQQLRCTSSQPTLLLCTAGAVGSTARRLHSTAPPPDVTAQLWALLDTHLVRRVGCSIGKPAGCNPRPLCGRACSWDTTLPGCCLAAQ